MWTQSSDITMHLYEVSFHTGKLFRHVAYQWSRANESPSWRMARLPLLQKRGIRHIYLASFQPYRLGNPFALVEDSFDSQGQRAVIGCIPFAPNTFHYVRTNLTANQIFFHET
ncbi:hypothetical protein M408DRAFT_162736 [Serendipita vermifera MAFF 305830]|uniref:Uncharacterized protein n=1 Tax=Serendipita vermifera MAFF 305830 TaxID=933852 RepID=A0A0C2WN37_SERVB|nr:hypothetical protein M408DRAFT_162736 [Serendipita vermifera MAFF 305830]